MGLLPSLQTIANFSFSNQASLSMSRSLIWTYPLSNLRHAHTKDLGSANRRRSTLPSRAVQLLLLQACLVRTLSFRLLLRRSLTPRSSFPADHARLITNPPRPLSQMPANPSFIAALDHFFYPFPIGRHRSDSSLASSALLILTSAPTFLNSI